MHKKLSGRGRAEEPILGFEDEVSHANGWKLTYIDHSGKCDVPNAKQCFWTIRS